MSKYKDVALNSDVENATEEDQYINTSITQKKAYNRMGFQSKLQIITAVDKGQTRTDIAKEFNVHPQTVSYIYKQKDIILKKCKQKNISAEDTTAEFNNNVLTWFTAEMKAHRRLKDENIKSKASEIAHSISNFNFKFTNEWWNGFKSRHNIVKHKGKIDGLTFPHREECMQWYKVTKGFEANDIYIGGICGLLHEDTLQTFSTDTLSIDRHVSAMLITNVTGADKHQLTIVGKHAPQVTALTLPLKYYYKENAQMDNLIITDVLKSWDKELKEKNRKVLLAFHLPDTYLEDSQLEQIRLLQSSKYSYVRKTVERIVNCFKYHYRKLQIMQMFSFRKDEVAFMDYVHTLSLAWHSVSDITLELTFYPRFSGCYYFDVVKQQQLLNEENDAFSLTQWCHTHGIPLKLDDVVLDNLVTCDNSITCLDHKQVNTDSPSFVNINRSLPHQQASSSSSAVDCFQAIKRLFRYSQGDNFSNDTLNSVKYLEDKLESDAYSELLQQIEKDSTNFME